jgi:hypothetical protein
MSPPKHQVNSRRSGGYGRPFRKSRRAPRLEELEPRWLPSGFFQPGQVYDTTGTGTARALVAMSADVNGDGKPDIVVLNQGSGGVQILQGNGDGTFKRTLVSVPTIGNNFYALAVADLKGDGQLDVISGSSYAMPTGGATIPLSLFQRATAAPRRLWPTSMAMANRILPWPTFISRVRMRLLTAASTFC